jgi:hypothetical protein
MSKGNTGEDYGTFYVGEQTATLYNTLGIVPLLDE